MAVEQAPILPSLLPPPDAPEARRSLGPRLVLAIREHANILDGPDLVEFLADLFLVAVVQGDGLVPAALVDLVLGGLFALLGDLFLVLVLVAAGLAQLL